MTLRNFFFNATAWLISFSLHAGSSSSIVLTPDEKTVCAVNQDGDSVSLWSWETIGEGTVREIHVGDEPRNLAFAADGRTLYVTLQRSQALVALNTETEEITSIPLAGQPVGIVLSAARQVAFVSLFAGDYLDGQYSPGVVAVVDLATNIVIHRVAVKPFPFAMALDAGRNRLYVTHYFLHEEQGVVSVIDTQKGSLLQEILLREDTNVMSGRGGMFTALAGIALHPTQPRALVVGMHANVRRGLTQSGRALSHKTTVQAAVGVLDLTNGNELDGGRIVSSFSGQAVAVPSAVAFFPSGEHFIDVYAVSHDLKIIAYNERGIVAERALLELPAGPSGVVVTGDGRTAFFNCRWDRSIAQVSTDDIRNPRVVRVRRTAKEPWDAARILGAHIFHNSRDTRMTPNRWLACGCCHLDGGLLSDNLVWEFTAEQKPSSPRMVNTKSLSLTAGSSPPLLIQGAYRTIQEEEKFIRSFLGGSGFCSTAKEDGDGSPMYRSPELDALAAFVLGLAPRPPPHRQNSQPRAEIVAAARRGRNLFHDTRVGCARCHQGSQLTRSGQDAEPQFVDVGTGIRADVPSLHGLWASPPYLHDGRAATLRDVLTTKNPDNRHGRTSHLSARDIDDLVAFLLAPF